MPCNRLPNVGRCGTIAGTTRWGTEVQHCSIARSLFAVPLLGIALAGCSMLGFDDTAEVAPPPPVAAAPAAVAPQPVYGEGAPIAVSAYGVPASVPAASPMVTREGWIVDQTTGCGTSNPFSNPEESIRWYGGCVDGMLDGRGTLIWYTGNLETERNEGGFVAGEFHGDVITTYPTGQVIVGQYDHGTRNGAFVIVKRDGGYVSAVYSGGELVTQRNMSRQDIARWTEQRSGGMTVAAVAPTVAPVGPIVEPIAEPSELQPAPLPVVESQPIAPVTIQQVAAPAAPAPVAAPAASVAAPAPVVMANNGVPSDVSLAIDNAIGVSRTAAANAAFSASIAGGASSVQAADRTESQMSATRLAEAVVEGIARYPQSTPAIVMAAVRRAPAYRDAIARRAATAYPGFAPQIAAAAGVPLATVMAPAPQPVAMPAVWQQPFYAYASAPVFSQPAAYPVVGRAPYAAAVPPVYAEAADARFAQAYQYERSGRFYEAEQSYEQIIMQYPSASSALLANARLNYLRDRTRQQGVQLAASTTAAGAGLPPVVAPPSTSGRVVAVNSPYPSSATLPSTTVSRENPDIIRESAALYKTVCSRSGVFDSNAGWCGIVTREQGAYYFVEVRELTLPGFGTIGLSRAPCTGNAFLTWLSRGSNVRVPKQCMAIQG